MTEITTRMEERIAPAGAIGTVGIVGAGVMGTGVAHAAAAAGLRAILVDVSADVLERARGTIRNDVRWATLLGKGRPAIGADDILSRVAFTDQLSALAGADFVVENVTEDLAIKHEVHASLDRICGPDVVIAANTSVLSITRLAAVTTRPERVVGIHFMNPVSTRPMVEVIRGFHTSAEALRRTDELLTRMSKRYVVVKDAPGFVLNRVLMLTVNEAIFLLHEGTASARDVDDLFKGCCGHAAGPLETADLIGLDTILASVQGLYESYADSKYRPCPLLATMVHAGLLGRKSGRGFYTYDTRDAPKGGPHAGLSA